MFSLSELITVLTIAGTSAVVICFAFYVLIKQAINQSKEAAANQVKADLNAQAIKDLSEANKIAHRPVTDDELTASLRDGSF